MTGKHGKTTKKGGSKGVPSTPPTPPTSASLKRTRSVLVTLFNEEKSQIEAGAAADGLSVAAFLRTAGLRRAVEALQRKNEAGGGR